MDVAIFDDGEGHFVGGGVRVLAGGAESPLAMLDTTVPPGFPGPKLHRHSEMFDIFYILDGSLLFQVGDDQRHLKKGGFAMIPPGVVHTFSNPSTEPARFINIYHPTGLEQYVIEIAKRFAVGTVPTQAEMAELAEDQDFEQMQSGKSHKRR